MGQEGLLLWDTKTFSSLGEQLASFQERRRSSSVRFKRYLSQGDLKIVFLIRREGLLRQETKRYTSQGNQKAFSSRIPKCLLLQKIRRSSSLQTRKSFSPGDKMSLQEINQKFLFSRRPECLFQETRRCCSQGYQKIFFSSRAEIIFFFFMRPKSLFTNRSEGLLLSGTRSSTSIEDASIGEPFYWKLEGLLPQETKKIPLLKNQRFLLKEARKSHHTGDQKKFAIPQKTGCFFYRVSSKRNAKSLPLREPNVLI